MTAGAGTRQSTRTPRPGRIIERPRLIKQLDAAEAPVILIVGPAGYGKTTLARQWTRTLSGVIWVACTPSHRDVVTFSEDVAAGIDALGGNASRFIGEYMRARSNPQRAAREIAQALAKKLEEAPVQWLVIDDYQELSESPEAEEMVEILTMGPKLRLLVVSRLRPRWANARKLVYNDVAEVGAAELALTSDEVEKVIGSRPELQPLVRQARGWPAVVALAAALPHVGTLEPAATLHRYVAEELFVSVETALQEALVDLALLPDLTETTLRKRFGRDAERVLADSTNLGFVTSDAPPILHPLLREFLLAKIAGADRDERVRQAVQIALDAEAWNLALDLILRFGLSDLSDPVLQRAFMPLVRSGRLETLRAFATRIKAAPAFPPAAVDVIDAELALRQGAFDLAAALADRAHSRLPDGHGLRCRASLLAGRSYFFVAAFADSARAYRTAADEAIDDEDRRESAFGLIGTQVFSEEGDPDPAIHELELLKHRSPTSLIRYATAELNLRRFAGFAAEMPLAEAVEALPLCPDPNARTAFTYTSAYLLCVRGEYRRALPLLSLFEHDIDEFDLDFARPFLDWTHAFVNLGLRRFGEADRRLQSVEDAAAEHSHRSHGFNARILRARLMLQTGEAAAAVDLLQLPADIAVFPSWQGELMATQALGLACLGLVDEAKKVADAAVKTSKFVEVTVLAHAARAVAATNAGNNRAELEALFDKAERSCVWDPVICALRASRDFAKSVAGNQVLRPIVREAVQRAEDTALARQLGLATRSRHTPTALLSPREIEVLGLMARGMRNKEIASALFIAESTVKVHVRHILEKLGVRSRSAAVARYERTADRYAD
jgi:ATP/maltotriose-dependent transcriptional regulator MalT